MAQQQKVIGTHSGTFHCDEALAVFLLRHTSLYRDASVIRTRDPALLSKCSVVVDVGGVYDPEKQLFDHHQRDFQEVFGGNFTTKLSSAGLVYKHFGEEVVATRTGFDPQDPKVRLLWLKMYQDFVEPLDGGDNGIPRFPADVKPKYGTGGTDLASRVSRLNPPWNKPSDVKTVDASFEEASQLTGKEFFERLDFYAHSWLPARDIVVAALKSRFQVHPSGQILLFEQFCPWRKHLFDLEFESPAFSTPLALYVVYPDDFGGSWRMQAVPLSLDSFGDRKSLPEAWRGLRDNELSAKCGVEGCIFVHASGFTGGNKTKSGALEMTKLALDM